MNIVITGGCGFIGTNLAFRMLENGHDVTILDSLIRPGSERNRAKLTSCAGGQSLSFICGDVADSTIISRTVQRADVIFHLAGQVSVVGGIKNPEVDFHSNAVGTFNVLEAARRSGRNPIVLVASTNKVYGGLQHLAHREAETRWTLPERPFGIAEDEPLNLATPYACSKGAGDFYTLDYARTLGLRAVVFRQSCIYGSHQQAMEDQAWVAWLMKAALRSEPITIFGDGKQVRDVLHVDDLIDAYIKAIDVIDTVSGMAFNVGGGLGLSLSIWAEFGKWLQNELGRHISVAYQPSRSGDQKVYISDIRLAEARLAWRPRIGVHEGLSSLLRWLKEDLSIGESLEDSSRIR